MWFGKFSGIYIFFLTQDGVVDQAGLNWVGKNIFYHTDQVRIVNHTGAGNDTFWSCKLHGA